MLVNICLFTKAKLQGRLFPRDSQNYFLILLFLREGYCKNKDILVRHSKLLMVTRIEIVKMHTPHLYLSFRCSKSTIKH